MAEHSRTGGSQDERLELLLFDLGGAQRFGINVLKVKEVIGCPRLTLVPQSHAAVRGVAHLRGEPLTVIDLSMAVGRPALTDSGEGSVIITEFNRNMQGFLVRKVDRIVVCEWRNVLPPPKGSGLSSYITGVTDISGELVQILDVEKVLGEVVRVDTSAATVDQQAMTELSGHTVMVVDDSSLARSQTAATLNSLGVETMLANDGREALQMLREMSADNSLSMVDMVISDIEMPEMDGYSLTRAIRDDDQLRAMYILLHTSLNGAINTEKAMAAGADAVLTKFVPDELALAVAAGLRDRG